MDDISPFLSSLRPLDRQECLVCSGIPPGISLRYVVPEGDTRMLTLPDGTPLVMWGARRLKNVKGVGLIWLLATTPAERHVLSLHRLLREELGTALEAFPMLWNVVWEKNDLHVRWLRRVGADFIAHHPSHGPLQEPFLEFTITNQTLTALARSAS